MSIIIIIILNIIPESHLAVARGVGVPVGQGPEGVLKPGPLGDEWCQGNVGHGGLCVSGATRVVMEWVLWAWW